MFFIILFLLVLWVVMGIFWVWIQIMVWREDRWKKKHEAKLQEIERQKRKEKILAKYAEKYPQNK